MTLLQSRKSLWGLTGIRDSAFKGPPITRPGRFSNLAANNTPGYAGLCSGTYRFWKRRGWRFYPVITRYLVPTTSIPLKGFPVMAFCLDHPASSNREWVDFTAQLCLSGVVVLMVELPSPAHTLKQQAQTFLEAAWLTLAARVCGLANSPVRLSWWGIEGAAPVVEQAARLRHFKYYLPPENILSRPFTEAAPAPEEETGALARRQPALAEV